MTEIDEIKRRYGIPRESSVRVFDYSSMPTRDLIERIAELRRSVVGFNDETLDEAIEVNELVSLEEEFSRRTLCGEAVLSLDDELASIMTSSRLKLLSTLTRSDGAHSIRELALKLKRPEKSVSRDVEILARNGLVIARDVSDSRGRRREIRVGANKLILIPDTKSVSEVPEAASTSHP